MKKIFVNAEAIQMHPYPNTIIDMWNIRFTTIMGNKWEGVGRKSIRIRMLWRDKMKLPTLE